MLDLNSLITESGYVGVGVTVVSPDEALLAYSVDNDGDEVFTLKFRDLRRGEDMTEEIPRSYYGGAWSSDSRWFFYTVHDDAYRPDQVWRHRIGTSAADDVLVLVEPDERFEVNLRATRSGDYVVIWSESRTTSECWIVDSRRPETPPRSVGGRRPGVLYRIEHEAEDDGPGRLLVVTNDAAPEFRVMAAGVPTTADQDAGQWMEIRPEDPAERPERIDAFRGRLVLTLRTAGERQLRLLPPEDPSGPGITVRSRFVGGEVGLARNTAYDVEAVTVIDQAHVEPPEWSAITLATGEVTRLHRDPAPGHDPDRYLTERRTYPAPDGTPVPATVVRHRDVPLDGTPPALIYGYGAYEFSFPPAWDAALPSLLDRGVVYVHAHIRGGGEGGRGWYLSGRLAHKQHTFSDFAAVADGLAAGAVDGSRIASRGLSAGGLLQGAVFGQRPDRWRAVVAEVPFVDVVTTMLDASTPLTVNEYDEWGDPRIREQFDWMLAYSPYENPPPPGGRPDLLVTGAVHDPRVMVREPAKWVASLRSQDPDWSPRCLFRCELGAGAHSGPSGRAGHLAYEAEVYAWILERLAG